MADLDVLLDALVQRLAVAVARELRAGAPPDWTDQARSPLGARRHCRIVRALVARGEPGAAIVGRRHLLSPIAIHDALSSGGKASRAKPGKPAGGVADELRRELALVKGGAR